MFYGLSEAVRKTTVAKLRLWFATTEPIVLPWKYNANPKVSKIQIYDEFPQEETFRPNITITSASNGTTGEYGLGQYLEKIEDPVTHARYNKFGGKARFNMTMVLDSWNKPNMESLADVILVSMADGGAVRGMLEGEGIVIEPDAFVRIGNESEIQVDQLRKAYQLNLSFPIVVNWKRTVLIVAEKMTDGVFIKT